MIAIPISTRLIPLFSSDIRLPSVRVRRRRLHQDTVCRRPDGTQVQLAAGRASRRHLRDAQGALQAVWNPSHPHPTAGHTEQNAPDRKAGQELERKQHDQLQTLRATAGCQNQENRFPLNSPPPVLISSLQPSPAKDKIWNSNWKWC